MQYRRILVRAVNGLSQRLSAPAQRTIASCSVRLNLNSSSQQRSDISDTNIVVTSDNGSDPGIDSLQRHVQQLGRDRRNVFLRSFMRDIQAHALSIKSFLEVTEEETRGSDEDLERDAGIARFMLRWYSASIDEVKKGKHTYR